MLDQMKQHNTKLKEHFWEEEKNIATMKAELVHLSDTLKQKQR